jgi:hypothetical protein
VLTGYWSQQFNFEIEGDYEPPGLSCLFLDLSGPPAGRLKMNPQ